MRLDIASPALREGVRALLEDDPELEIEGTGPALDEADVIVTTNATGDPETQSSLDSRTEAKLILRNEPIDQAAWLSSVRPPALLPLDASAEELNATVHALAAGLTVASGALLRGADDGARSDDGPLTEREVEVLELLAQGLANKQIAVRLAISEHTVKFHVSSIYTKLNASNRTQAVREGLRNGWIAL